MPQPVTLGQVASITRGASPLAIEEYNQLPQVSVDASLAHGAVLGTVAGAVRNAVESIGLPSGYDFVMGGQVKQQSTATTPLFAAIALSPLLVYMLLAALYESLVLPFAVLLALPLAVVGALFALFVDRGSLNLFSLIGMIMLVGLVSKNGILLVDYTETLQQRGMGRAQAVIEAAATRMRPILMTTLTLVIAMLPLALGTSTGSEERAPMAEVLIGGMTSSTLLTLLFVPTLYTYLASARDRWVQWRGKQPRLRRFGGADPLASSGAAGDDKAGDDDAAAATHELPTFPSRTPP